LWLKLSVSFKLGHILTIPVIRSIGVQCWFPVGVKCVIFFFRNLGVPTVSYFWNREAHLSAADIRTGQVLWHSCCS